MAYSTKEAEREYFRKRYVRIRRFLRKYKKKKGCKDCGYNKHHAALQFDHLPRFAGTKRAVSTHTASGMPTLLKEMAKCVVRCANCHAIKTHERKQNTGAARKVV